MVRNVLQIQIKQAQLREKGTIEMSNKTNWKQVDDFDVNDSNFKPDVDYYNITLNRRAFLLGGLDLPFGYVLTKLCFELNEGYLNLISYGQKFDFLSGKLMDADTTYERHNGNDRKVIIDEDR